MPDFFGLKPFADGHPLSEHLRHIHEMLTALLNAEITNGEYLRDWLVALEQVMCARVTQARCQEEQLMLLEAQRPRALEWLRHRYGRGGI